MNTHDSLKRSDGRFEWSIRIDTNVDDSDISSNLRITRSAIRFPEILCWRYNANEKVLQWHCVEYSALSKAQWFAWLIRFTNYRTMLGETESSVVQVFDSTPILIKMTRIRQYSNRTEPKLIWCSLWDSRILYHLDTHQSIIRLILMVTIQLFMSQIT